MDHGVVVFQEGDGARGPPAHHAGRLPIGIAQPPVLVALPSTQPKLNTFKLCTEGHLAGVDG